ncbi:hypothetical protein Ancab_028977 [Ancistrocladus abbreviatus]
MYFDESAPCTLTFRAVQQTHTQSPTPTPTPTQNLISLPSPVRSQRRPPARPNSQQSAAPQVRSTAAAPQPPLSPLRRDGVLLLRGLDSRISKDLPSDLQKLRCKVAFQALKFAPQILELGNKIAETQATLFGMETQDCNSSDIRLEAEVGSANASNNFSLELYLFFVVMTFDCIWIVLSC